MVEEVGPERQDEPVVLDRRPEACLVLHDGALVSIRRAMLTPADLRRFRHAVDSAAMENPQGLVMLTVFRLHERFPIARDTDADLDEHAQTLRAVDRRVKAIATVVEFGGIRASVLRLASKAVWALARPRVEMQTFERVSDAAQWLVPHASEVGAPDDVASYVRAYRLADRELRSFDGR